MHVLRCLGKPLAWGLLMSAVPEDGVGVTTKGAIMKSGMRTVIYAFALMALAACSSGDGGGGTTPVASAPPLTGTFVDAPVVGLPYATSSGLSGVTDNQGRFSYRAGDTIRFSYGQTTIGPIPTAPQVTPWTAFGLNSPDPADPRWINLARFLQTFNNNLQVVTSAIQAVPAIDFSLPIIVFTNDPNVGQLLMTANAPQPLVSAAQATATLTGQFALLGSWFVQGNPPNPNSFIVFTAMADGTFVLSEDGTNDPTGRDGMERGTYTWNPATNAFTATVSVDTNGQIGLSHTNPPLTAIVTGNTVTFTETGGTPVVLSRVVDPVNPFVGAWRFDNTDGPGTIAVLTLFENGTFVLVTDETAPINDGIERGLYSRDPATGNVTFTRLPLPIDTNADTGVFDPAVLGSVVVNVVVNGDTMTVTEPGNPTPIIGTRIRPPQ
jgi:hypothetical protein